MNISEINGIVTLIGTAFAVIGVIWWTKFRIDYLEAELKRMENSQNTLTQDVIVSRREIHNRINDTEKKAHGIDVQLSEIKGQLNRQNDILSSIAEYIRNDR